MIRGLFPRLFGNFREGGIVHAKFVTAVGGAGSTYALKTNRAQQNYQGLTLVRNAAVGRLTLTLTGGARSIALLSAHAFVAGAGNTALMLAILPRGAAIVESTGVLDLLCLQAAADTVQDTAIGDELHFTLYVDR